jgi:ABC-type multidrug transport system fused ATPase/permease subunit
VLEKTHIAETGTHQELVSVGGLYNRLYTAQRRLQHLSA